MPETWIEKNQLTKTGIDIEQQEVSFLGLASQLGYNVVTISPLMSGLMMQVPLPSAVTKANYVAAKHLNLVRSLPFESILTTVFGAKTNRHLKINLTTTYLDMVTQTDLEELVFSSTTRKQTPEKMMSEQEM